jgi:hypothetical protein
MQTVQGTEMTRTSRMPSGWLRRLFRDLSTKELKTYPAECDIPTNGSRWLIAPGRFHLDRAVFGRPLFPFLDESRFAD